ncbi:aminoglycoside phosphotransferase family protein [Prosthecobacter sp.]|uniref:phosphotransferase family protein n=1 Tax=Prosthecobacter sp. TaxID=1965333 RepID=UPI001DD6FE90|nr:aminoglycoside phosphotransferase family protein [Prosthecobacter sp.]MCB1276584.1 aminoglycoside phosphotransferase family protein [Prosthecobacter sp.]
MTTTDLLPHLQAAGLTAGEVRVTPLTGGVSSDIVCVESSKGSIVVKTALEKLRVKDDWFADVSRNRVERMYFEYAAPIIPHSVPRILGGGDGWFAMEHLGEMTNWKTALLSGEVNQETARLAGEVLGKLHAASWLDDRARIEFDTLPNFHALRIEPYLLTTASRVPEVGEILQTEAARLAETKLALVHGDYSPKNLLVAPQRLVVLDAECGWFGDPAFDTAFLLTHLHLKALLHARVAELITAFWTAYAAACGQNLEQRTVKLLLCLLLARVHGKSPVEYLSEEQRAFVTRFVLARLLDPPSFLAALAADWTHA